MIELAKRERTRRTECIMSLAVYESYLRNKYGESGWADRVILELLESRMHAFAANLKSREA